MTPNIPPTPGSPGFPLYRPRLHLFALLLVILTFILIATGGNVTSHGAGLAVLDWPTTYSYNMFTYPIDLWTGGVFHEHVHRLKGSLIGFLTIGICIWIWRTQGPRRWLHWTAGGLLLLVIIQGILGGYRVMYATGDFTGLHGEAATGQHLIKEGLATTLAVIHGIMGQLFLCLTILVSAATSKWWMMPSAPGATNQPPANSPAVKLAWMFLVAVILQLALGAAIRHTKSALAIPDFPLSYGQVIPPLDQAGIDAARSHMSPEYWKDHYHTMMVPERYVPYQVIVAFAHRVGAVVVTILGGLLIWLANRDYRAELLVRRPVLAILVLLILQVLLGMLVIWSLRFPYISTAHQAVGAAVLGTAFLTFIRMKRLSDDADAARVRITSPGPGKGPMMVGVANG